MRMELMLRHGRPTSRPVSVVLAEDHDELRELLARALEADGALVTAVPDGEAASMQLATHDLPDVLVTDVRMPGRTGIELLRDIRRKGCSIPVVLITGFGDTVDASEVAALGGAVVLEKPFDFDDLRTALRNLDSIARLPRAERTTG